MGKMIATKWVGLIIALVLILAQPAYAHVSEQGIVLLLPTNFYILSGCLAVVISMLIVSILPHETVFKIYKQIEFSLPFASPGSKIPCLQNITSLFSLGVVVALIITGVIGSRDPLVNLLPLSIWTFWWIAIFSLHCVFGNLWQWMNPWTGLYNLLFKNASKMFSIHAKVGNWPAIILFVCFYTFIIADLAPDDPARLSNVVLFYIILNFIGMVVFGGKDWLHHVECFTLLFRLLALLSPIQINLSGKKWAIGLPGWQALQKTDVTLSQAFFLLTMLASGSFDGVNETFWWLGQIGVNPLAFPGRSAVIWHSTFGMLGANLLLYAIFFASIWFAFILVRSSNSPSTTITQSEFWPLFIALAISVLPITAVYHASHYMTSFMVNGQYLIAALSDPFANGSNLLGLENYQVTTGYLNDVESVRKIWLTQASVVVIGHVIAVLMAHYVIAQHFVERKKAIVFHIPIAVFMAAYTWFGLWLLAAPKGA